MRTWLMAAPLWKVATLAFATSTMWFAFGEPEGPHPRAQRSTYSVRDWFEPEPILDVREANELELVQGFRRGEQASLAELEPFVHDRRQRVARAAIDAVANLGGSEILVAALDRRGQAWRNESLLRALGRVGDRRAVDALVECIDSEDYAVPRWLVIESLAATHSPDAVEPLRRLVESRSNARHDALAERAVDAMAALAVPAADRTIIEWAATGSPTIRPLALRLVPDPERPASIRVLRLGLAERNVQIASAAAIALAGSTHVLQAELEQCLRRDDYALVSCMDTLIQRGSVDVVAAAIERRSDLGELIYDLGRIEGGEAVLRRLESAPDPDVRENALYALAEFDESARDRVLQLAQHAGPVAQIEIGQQLLTNGVSAGVELLVGGVLGRVPHRTRHQALHALANGNLESVAALRDLARSGEGALREQAVSALLARSTPLEEDDFDIIEHALDGGNVSVLNSLRNQHHARLQQILRERVGDARIGVRAMDVLVQRIPVAEALQLAGNDPRLQRAVLTRTLEDDPRLDAILRSQADDAEDLETFVAGLGEPASPAVERFLREQVGARRDPATRMTAMRQLRHKLSAEELSVHAADRDVGVRRTALEMLQGHSGIAATDAGLRGVRDPEPDLRRASVFILGDSNSPEAADALLDATHDTDTDVAVAAVCGVLDRIGGDVVDEIVAQALNPSVDRLRRAQFARELLAREMVDDPETLASLQAATIAHRQQRRVIQLDQIRIE